MAALDLDAFLARERARVEAALERVRAGAAQGTDPALAGAVDYALGTQGKRLRPILCAAAFAAVRGAHAGPPPAGVYGIGCAVELVHTYSLVHDDLPCMDDDDLRRGRPTTHRVHGVALATLAGAALLPLAARTLDRSARALDLDAERRVRLLQELCDAAGAAGMVGGQVLDLHAEQRDVRPTELETIHRAKTGALLTASLRLGALAAGAGGPELDAFTRYGQALGLAFQIADDVLDVTGDAEALGKTAGRDEALRKASYPALHGLEGARRLARSRADEAKRALQGLHAPELRALADYVVERER